ncbi:MAG: nucleotidyltransferase domain-containing protein [Planctomycetota bacterium]
MTEELRKEIERAAAVLKEFGAKEVYVFGSAATGSLTEDSDVDLAVAGLPPRSFIRAMGKAGRVLSRQLDLLDLDEDSLFTRYLKREGKLLRVA